MEIHKLCFGIGLVLTITINIPIHTRVKLLYFKYFENHDKKHFKAQHLVMSMKALFDNSNDIVFAGNH